MLVKSFSKIGFILHNRHSSTEFFFKNKCDINSLTKLNYLKKKSRSHLFAKNTLLENKFKNLPFSCINYYTNASKKNGLF